MPVLLVTGHSKAKSGRDRIECGKDMYYVGNKCASIPPIGSYIQADTSDGSFTAKDGKRVEMWWLNDWNLAPEQPTAEQTKTMVTNAAVQHASNGKWQQQEATLRFVSNVIGQALSALQIKSPGDIHLWAQAALKAANGVLEGKIPTRPFDDKLNGNENVDPEVGF